MTNVGTIKIVVLGSRRCGKSALTVRYLTKRFIGEYRSNVDLLYKQTIVVDNVTSEIEILDVSRWMNDDSSVPLEQIRWADALVVVYNICDGASFDAARKVLAARSSTGARPIVLLGNKRDLEHGRSVAIDTGRELAVHHNCLFAEVSAAESHQAVSAAFGELIREVRATTATTTTTISSAVQQMTQAAAVPSRQRKISMFAVSKMIGAIIGHGRSNSAKGFLGHVQNNNNNNSVDCDHGHGKKKKRPSLSL